MPYMDPRPEGLNTEKAPESIVEMLKPAIVQAFESSGLSSSHAHRTAFSAGWNAAQQKWQPIETAPKDGSMFLVWVNATKFGEDDEGRQFEQDCSQVDFAEWRTEGDIGWVNYFAHPFADQEYVTHWMPLPAAPNDEVKA